MKKYIKLFNWTFIGTTIYSLCQWLIVFILNKNFEYESVGLYTFALALTSPVFIFSFLQLRTVYITRVSDKIELFFKLRLYLMLITFISISTFTLLNGFESNYIIIIIAISIIKLSEGISDIVYSYYHREQEMKVISLSIITRSSTALLVFIFMYIFTRDFALTLLVQSIYIFLYSLIYDVLYLYLYRARLKLKLFKLKNYWDLTLLALPMGIVTVIGNLSVNFPRYILESRASIELLGVFGSLIYLITILTKITSSLSQVLSPNLASAYTENKYSLFRNITFIGLGINISIGLVLIISIALLGDVILSLLYNDEYTKYTKEFMYLSIYGLFVYIGGFLGNVLTSMKIFKVQVYIHITKFLIVIVSSFFLINENLSGIISVIIISSIFSVIIYSLIIIFNIKQWRALNEQ